MSEPLRYVTNAQGEQVGVLLDLDDYRRLSKPVRTDPDLLQGLSLAELQALAQGLLVPATQAHLDELLARHANRQLSAEETAELDQILETIDQLILLKTRARYTLVTQATAATQG